MANKRPKILYLDIECSRTVYELEHYTGRGVDYISHKNIKHPWYITCAAWAWLDIKNKKIGKVHTSKVSDYDTYDEDFRNDLGVVEELIEAIDQADLIVGHNSDNFDLKKIGARYIKHKLSPPNMPPTVDTLKVARKYGFQSKSLEYLAKELDCKFTKIELAPGTMHKADMGCEKSLNALSKYNIGDIKSGANLYFELLPYIANHPDIRRILNPKLTAAKSKRMGTCSTCGSDNVRSNGIRGDKQGPYRRLNCLDCNSVTKQRLKK